MAKKGLKDLQMDTGIFVECICEYTHMTFVEPLSNVQQSPSGKFGPMS